MGENVKNSIGTVASNVTGNLPKNNTVSDSADEVKALFNQYYTGVLEFPSNEVDATVGFFEKRGFDTVSAGTISTIILQQAKIDNVKVFELLDTLKGFTDIQLSNVITEVLNYNRSKISTLGYKVSDTSTRLETRNIMV
jgi:hypothetical protein